MTTTETLTTILSTVSLLIALVSLPITVFALIELRSFMKSTHKVEFVPYDDAIPLKKELKQDDTLEKYDLA